MKAPACLALAIALQACAHPVPTEPVYTPRLPWCFGVRVRFDGRTRFAQACAETRALCQQASGVAVKVGSMGGLSAVGECEERD
jgi:hypothetical protein